MAFIALKIRLPLMNQLKFPNSMYEVSQHKEQPNDDFKKSATPSITDHAPELALYSSIP